VKRPPEGRAGTIALGIAIVVAMVIVVMAILKTIDYNNRSYPPTRAPILWEDLGNGVFTRCYGSTRLFVRNALNLATVPTDTGCVAGRK